MTQTVFIDASRYAAARELHLALKAMLDLPAYYGCNADALHDCLTERTDRVNAVIVSEGEGETAEALKKCLRVIEDCGGDVKKIAF